MGTKYFITCCFLVLLLLYIQRKDILPVVEQFGLHYNLDIIAMISCVMYSCCFNPNSVHILKFITGVLLICLTYFCYMKSKYVLAAIAFIVLVMHTSLCTNNNPAYVPQETSVLKTVAHIDLSNRKDLSLISVDYENDVAYYKYVNPNYAVVIGDTVTLYSGVKATLTTTDAIGFTIECDIPIEAGFSGTAVCTENGTQIGYISKRLSNGNIRCIWS